MARKRMIDPNIWMSEDFSRLSSLSKLVFIGLFSQADDEGRGRAKPIYIKSVLFPYDEGMRLIDIEKSLSEIGANMSVTFYESNGNQYYSLDNWSKWQKVEKAYKSQFPEPSEPFPERSPTIPRTFPNHSLLREENTREENIREESASDKPPPAPSKQLKKKYGEYGWVRLTDEEHERLISDHGAEITVHYIELVDSKAQQTGNKNKWKDWNLTVRNAIRDKWGGTAHQKSAPKTQSKESAGSADRAREALRRMKGD